MLCHVTRPDSVVMEVEVDAKANGEDCLNKVGGLRWDTALGCDQGCAAATPAPLNFLSDGGDNVHAPVAQASLAHFHARQTLLGETFAACICLADESTRA